MRMAHIIEGKFELRIRLERHSRSGLDETCVFDVRVKVKEFVWKSGANFQKISVRGRMGERMKWIEVTV